MTTELAAITIRTADPGSDDFLTAVEWLCKRKKWGLCDRLLTQREDDVLAEQARKRQPKRRRRRNHKPRRAA